jgi:phage terminase small subunit
MEDRMATAKATHKPKMDILVNPKTKGLTEKQEKFCRIYATEDVTRTEAARQAGFADNTAAWAASRFLNGRDYPHVLVRIAEIKEELSRKYEVTFDSHIRQLAKIRDMALEKGNYTAAVAAEKSRGQAGGLYISRSEILVGKIDQMSREDVIAEIAKLQQQFPVLMQSTSPTIDMIANARDPDGIPDFVPDDERQRMAEEIDQ